MVKESQKLKYKRGSFKDFLEESTTLREQMKRTQDPNRHDWKTLNEYVLTLSDARVKYLYGKYEIFASSEALAAGRQPYEKYEKDERKLIEKKQKQQQLMQVQQQSQQQIKSTHETHFVSDQPRGNYPLCPPPFRSRNLDNQRQRSRSSNNKFAVPDAAVPYLHVLLVKIITRFQTRNHQATIIP